MANERGAGPKRRNAKLVAVATVLLANCRQDLADHPAPPAASPAEARLQLVDVTATAGVDFRHQHCGTGRRFMPETMGSGGAWFDYDGDGWVDLYLVNGAPTPGFAQRPPVDALYRNLGDGTFEDVARRAAAESPGYGMGATVGDVDNDGDADLFVTNFGEDVLLANDGDGTFTDATRRAGASDPLWSMSAAFGDVDADGDLDLYVTNYVDFTYETHKVCGDPRTGFEAYCHPDVYSGVPDSLYLNQGDGSFVPGGPDRLPKEPLRWREEGKGLGVTFIDVELDGDADIFVGNDSTPNFLWLNRGDGFFEDVAVVSGVAFDEEGAAEACMGVGVGDLDEDGDSELFVTNLDFETNTLYANEGGSFVGRTFEAGLEAPSWLMVGFGTELVDLDLDGRLDILVANGHIIDNIHLRRSAVTYAQPSQLFMNLGGLRFRDASREVGEALSRPSVGRGLATADYDRDGDRDALFTRNDAPAALLRTDAAAAGGWLAVQLEGTLSNRDGYGARVVVEVSGRRLVRERRSASSYLSQSDATLHFGWPGAPSIDRVEVTWPSGRRQLWSGLPTNRYVRLVEGAWSAAGGAGA